MQKFLKVMRTIGIVVLAVGAVAGGAFLGNLIVKNSRGAEPTPSPSEFSLMSPSPEISSEIDLTEPSPDLNPSPIASFGDITISPQVPKETLATVVVGVWSLDYANTIEGRPSDYKRNFEKDMTKLELGFDANGNFFQSASYKEGEESTTTEWIWEGTYKVVDNDITFNLNDATAPFPMFWNNKQLEQGNYNFTTKRLQYKTRYQKSGEVVYFYFKKI